MSVKVFSTELSTGGYYLMGFDFVALFLAFVCGIAGGGLSYLVFHWGHIRFQLGLDYRLSDLEGRVSREVKIRAAEAHQKKVNIDKELLEVIKEAKPQQELTMQSWRDNAFKR